MKVNTRRVVKMREHTVLGEMTCTKCGLEKAYQGQAYCPSCAGDLKARSLKRRKQRHEELTSTLAKIEFFHEDLIQLIGEIETPSDEHQFYVRQQIARQVKNLALVAGGIIKKQLK